MFIYDYIDYIKHDVAFKTGESELTRQDKQSIKRDCLLDGSYNLYKDFCKTCYFAHLNNEQLPECFYNDFYNKFNPVQLVYCDRLYNAYIKRVQRLKDRIQSMLLSGQCIFLTLTFTDDILNNTNALTRRKYVRRYLKLVSKSYVANIDFGSKKEREHYHALVFGDNINYSNWHKIGAIKGERVRFNKDSDNNSTNTKLAKYISKLTNHSIKETTHNSYIIYSKSF